jgi:hypothetical protein
MGSKDEALNPLNVLFTSVIAQKARAIRFIATFELVSWVGITFGFSIKSTTTY